MKVFGIVGWKNSGKTGLVERLVRELASRGYAMSTVKHAHHSFEIDKPGKDSHRHRAAGAKEVLLASSRRWALIHELGDADEPNLEDLLQKLAPADLVLVEGFKSGGHAKLETRRREAGGPEIAASDPSVKAIACDVPPSDAGVPAFELDDTTGIADFIVEFCGLRPDGR